MEPFVQSTTLNEELKNPHLVETLIRVAPSTGKRIQNASLDDAQLTRVLAEKLSGKIPEFDVNFNVQGVPLILSKQSHLELRLTPVFKQPLQILEKWPNLPLTFEYNRALWPKVNAACVAQASATFSNFSVESPIPMLMPYLRYFQMPDDLRTNYSRAWNPSYISEGDGGNYYYANRYVTSTITGAFTQPIHRSPYEVTAVQLNDQIYCWHGQPLLIQIPLEDILPVFQVPVIPLRQTNTSNINIRLRLRSPRHMFFSAAYFNPPSTAAFVNYGANNINTFIQGINALVTDDLMLGDGTAKDIQTLVVGGGTLEWLKALTSYPFARYGSIKSFMVDFNVDCELVLHCLTAPLLNPLAQRYIEPFIDEQNQFVAHFSDYYTYSQTLNSDLLANNRFSFTPSQLFYNTTHVALFFMQDVKDPNIQVNLPQSLSEPLPVGDLTSLFNHAHFVIRENIDITQFNILLGSSCVPLFDHPLTMADMMVATEEAMKKYNPNEMYGDLIFLQSRLQEGDAFFLFDLTHARNSGFFIDADNMMRVEGVITQRQPLDQGTLTNPVQLPQQGNARASIYGKPTQARAQPSTTPLIHVIMMLLYQNTFTVLLDLDGAVLFQQQ